MKNTGRNRCSLPYPLAPDMVTYRIAHAMHVAAAVLLATLILLHIAAAMFHALGGRTPLSTSGDTVRKPV
jgi:cytochrome b561